MAQSNAVQDQPSMEDILTSIRRIIDDSNVKAPNTSVPSSEEIANDDLADALPTPQKHVSDSIEGETSGSQIDEIPELDSFLESLDAKYTAQQSADEASGSVPEAALPSSDEPQKTNVESVDSSIALIDDAMNTNQNVVRDNSKYESRFSEDDRTAFAAVGDVLTANTSQTEKPAEARSLDTKPHARTLISEPARARVGGSLNTLSEVLAQEAQRQLPAMTESMLKPMLADWLDNNLPSMVERLVREEIERIARGD